ncbi:hypothetical protein HMPREF9371_1978 [Neisseria shayeganii 871]|uniref:Uncharacterized protein n=1 Tax=Neisseria shayeganii 871 TaxID=1032488 RepID=G4CK38_9NEIS|nr:hypothetical protein HMPREF9371_1978 [Neisseria shayeganii 871]
MKHDKEAVPRRAPGICFPRLCKDEQKHLACVLVSGKVLRLLKTQENKSIVFQVA